MLELEAMLDSLRKHPAFKGSTRGCVRRSMRWHQVVREEMTSEDGPVEFRR
jgi:hypothetical protein